MLPRPKPEDIAFSASGRTSVITRMQILYGEDVIVLKAQKAARTAETLLTKVLTPTHMQTIFGSVLYPDWAGEPNTLHAPAELVCVESNRASTYLVFRPR